MRLAVSLAVLTVAAALPFVLDRGGLFLASEILVMLALAQAWNLAAGYGGLLSLGWVLVVVRYRCCRNQIFRKAKVTAASRYLVSG